MDGIKKYFNGFTKMKWLAFVIVTLLVALALEQQVRRVYWEYWDFEPVKFEGKIKILNPILSPGENLVWGITVTKYMPIIPEISCQLINHIIYTITVDPVTDKDLNVRRSYLYTLRLPRSADYGQYIMRRTYRYPVGPYGRVIIYTVDSEPFTVVPPDAVKKMLNKMDVRSDKMDVRSDEIEKRIDKIEKDSKKPVKKSMFDWMGGK